MYEFLHPRVAIIGAGFGGIVTAIKLQKAGLDCVVFERSEGVGGTWWDNRYAAHLGFAPKDSSEVFRAEVEAQPPVAADDPAKVYQGGAFCAAGPFGD